MEKLLKYLRNYKVESVIGPLFKMLEACFELITPIIMARIIDIGVKNADTGYILKLMLVLIAFGFLGLICSVTAQFFAAKASYGFGTELRRDMFSHISSLSYSELDKIGTSTLITRVTNDIMLAQSGVNLVLRLFLRSPFIVIGALIASFMINAKIALIFLAAAPVFALIIYWNMVKTIPIFRRVQKQLDKISLITRENLTGVRVIRAFSKQESEKADFREANEALRQSQLGAGKITALLNPLTYAAVNIAILLVIWCGGISVNSGIITQGEVIALVNYMMQILLALVALANLIVSFTKAQASSLRINEIFEIKSSMSDGSGEAKEDESAPAVEFKDVSFSYARARETAVRGISFTAQRGETIGIIGGTGSGKSTLVNLIPRFYDASSGSVMINGAPVSEYRLEELRKKIGVVPQKAVLFRGTIRSNMRWGDENASDEDIMRAIKTAQAEEVVADKENGLDSVIEQGGKNLSGGQRQRLTIARALVSNPEILILDDSASALDFATDAALRRAIAESTRDMTVFIVSQRASSIKNADKIIVLDDGEQVGCGTHDELFRDCGVYREICLSQLSESEAE